MKTAYLFLAPGFEEVEAITPIDLLRRAEINVRTVAVAATRAVVGAHGIPVEADIMLSDVSLSDADMLIAPGGMPGAANLAASPEVCSLFEAQAKRGGYVAAICAAPSVLLATLGIVNGRRATCYPGFDDTLCASGAEYVRERVVVDGNVITANGPSSATPFALALIDILSPGSAEGVAAGILL
ncbi:MAG: DJ-1/PfpI family protein [Duncaniella sp.]|nr:DJ-1/PfpI family protein [Duncaniella sp.]